VDFLLDAKFETLPGEGLFDPVCPAVHNHKPGPVLEQEALDHLIGELRVVPVSNTGDDDTHAGGFYQAPSLIAA
jgi:hypothetical protein